MGRAGLISGSLFFDQSKDEISYVSEGYDCLIYVMKNVNIDEVRELRTLRGLEDRFELSEKLGKEIDEFIGSFVRSKLISGKELMERDDLFWWFFHYIERGYSNPFIKILSSDPGMNHFYSSPITKMDIFINIPPDSEPRDLIRKDIISLCQYKQIYPISTTFLSIIDAQDIIFKYFDIDWLRDIADSRKAGISGYHKSKLIDDTEIYYVTTRYGQLFPICSDIKFARLDIKEEEDLIVVDFPITYSIKYENLISLYYRAGRNYYRNPRKIELDISISKNEIVNIKILP